MYIKKILPLVLQMKTKSDFLYSTFAQYNEHTWRPSHEIEDEDERVSAAAEETLTASLCSGLTDSTRSSVHAPPCNPQMKVHQ